MQTRRVPPGEIGIDLGAMATFLERTGPLAVVDLETTGLSNDRGSEILEVGIVQLTPGDPEVMLAETLVRPREAIPRAVVRLTGLTDADVEKAPRVEAVAKDGFALRMGRTLVAHNADFERHFLTRQVSPELARARYLDTQDLLGAQPYFTRLYTTMSADEMTVDPVFVPRPGEDVPREVTLSRIVDGADMYFGNDRLELVRAALRRAGR